MTKTYCDLCHQERPVKKYILPYYSSETASYLSFDIKKDVEVDVCSFCENKIREFLTCHNFEEESKKGNFTFS